MFIKQRQQRRGTNSH